MLFRSKMQQEMQRLSAWLGQATEEGREALNSLRGSTAETNDLADAFRQTLDECRIEGYPEALFEVVGKPVDMHPIVRDEIFHIGYEAIRNACHHSKGNILRAHLSYGKDLVLSISDNGQGIEPDTLKHGKDGHFGLRGMRERAVRINSELKITSAPNSGTRIELTVPGHIIFRGNVKPWRVFLTRVRELLAGFRSNHDSNST